MSQSAENPHQRAQCVHIERPAGAHLVTTRQRDFDPTVRRGARCRDGLRQHLHRQAGQPILAVLHWPVAWIAQPPEDQVGVDVVAAPNLGHRNAQGIGLRFSSSDQKGRVRRVTAKPPPMVSTNRWWTPSTSGPSHRRVRFRTDPLQGRAGRAFTLALRSSDIDRRLVKALRDQSPA